MSEGKKALSFKEYKALRFRELMMTLQVVGDQAVVIHVQGCANRDADGCTDGARNVTTADRADGCAGAQGDAVGQGEQIGEMVKLRWHSSSSLNANRPRRRAGGQRQIGNVNARERWHEISGNTEGRCRSARPRSEDAANSGLPGKRCGGKENSMMKHMTP